MKSSFQVAGTDQMHRTAFNSDALVFVPRPEPRWLSHKDCVWTAHKLLKRVTKLRTYYQKCPSLFHSLLEVEKAGTQHVVDEFCEPTSTDNDDIQQHFKELLFLLSEFHKKSKLTHDQISKIRCAPVFPVLAKETSRIEMRSLRNKYWYIPNVVNFEAKFRGKVNMLALSVQSARALEDMFEDLLCKGKLLSEAVVRNVTRNGMTVHNVRAEKDLRERLRYISRYENPFFPLKGRASFTYFPAE